MVAALWAIAVLLLCLVIVVAKGLSSVPAVGRAVVKLIDSRELDGDDDFEQYYVPGMVQLREHLKRMTERRDELAAKVAGYEKQLADDGVKV